MRKFWLVITSSKDFVRLNQQKNSPVQFQVKVRHDIQIDCLFSYIAAACLNMALRLCFRVKVRMGVGLKLIVVMVKDGDRG